jgi:hypothetical protein
LSGTPHIAWDACGEDSGTSVVESGQIPDRQAHCEGSSRRWWTGIGDRQFPIRPTRRDDGRSLDAELGHALESGKVGFVEGQVRLDSDGDDDTAIAARLDEIDPLVIVR